MATESKKGLIKYTSRDYESLVEEFWSIVSTLTELWQPASGESVWRPEANSDPGVVLGKFLCNVASMLGVNQDILVGEMFAPSVTQRKNAEKLFALIGYDLGWYTAAKTEVTFINDSGDDLTLDFGFNGANFCTVNAYTDITNQSRVITYNILPLTNSYANSESKNIRNIISDTKDIFAETDIVTLKPSESVTRVAIEGELRSTSVAVSQIKRNNYIIKLPSQHVDTTAIWIKSKRGNQDETIQWIQCTSPSDFITPEPRFAVTYDTYSNAQIQISNYLNELNTYDDSTLVVYWIDCSGAIGCVGEDVLTNFLPAKSQTVSNTSGDLRISNISNIKEIPHTYTVTGKSPETAKEAYYNSRNYINTNDSLITLPDFNRFIKRESGVDTGIVIDCQKALEINRAIYEDNSLTTAQKSKMYITNQDFVQGDDIYDWKSALGLSSDPEYPVNFKRNVAMCYCIGNNFQDTSLGNGSVSYSQTQNTVNFIKYKPSQQFIDGVKRDFEPLQAMSVNLEFGYLRIFNWFAVGQITPTKPVTEDIGKNIIIKVKEALLLYFHPSNYEIGKKPSLIEIVDVIRNADDRIYYFDAGSLKTSGISWNKCDPEYFNSISFARYADDNVYSHITINPAFILK